MLRDDAPETNAAIQRSVLGVACAGTTTCEEGVEAVGGQLATPWPAREKDTRHAGDLGSSCEPELSSDIPARRKYMPAT